MNIFKKIQEFILPYTCVVCSKSCKTQQDLCSECKKSLPWIKHACQQCGRRLEQITIKCGQCLQHPPYFDETMVLFKYQPPIDKFIIQLKFYDKLLYSKIFSELFIDFFQKNPLNPVPDLIIPMPLHKKRLRQRGYNQALELAKPLAKQLNIPLDKNSCYRIKDTLAQTTLAFKERSKNVKNAFVIEKKLPVKSVLIIDDVITSGETCQALSKVLKQNDVEKITICCIARAGN